MSYAELEKAYDAERQRNQRLEKANEILKTASAFRLSQDLLQKITQYSCKIHQASLH